MGHALFRVCAVATDMTRRRSLTRNQRVRIFDANEGRCHICGQKIDGVREPWDADHVVPRGLTGSDALEEYKPAHEACHKEKTRTDNRTVKKAVRTRAKHLGIKGPSKWQSRFKRKVDGTTVDRNTGEPV